MDHIVSINQYFPDVTECLSRPDSPHGGAKASELAYSLVVLEYHVHLVASPPEKIALETMADVLTTTNQVPIVDAKNLHWPAHSGERAVTSR